MTTNFDSTLTSIKKKFTSLSTPEERYAHLIALGRALPPLPSSHQIPTNLISGCQSTLYLHTELKDSKIIFTASADALISAGLAALLISVYSGQTPETILRNPPLFLQELGIFASLSPNRSNGLAQIYLRMKKDALQFLTKP